MLPGSPACRVSLSPTSFLRIILLRNWHSTSIIFARLAHLRLFAVEIPDTFHEKQALFGTSTMARRSHSIQRANRPIV